MNKQIIYFLIGFVATISITMAMTYYLGKADPVVIDETSSEKIISADDFKEFDKDTKELKNNGNAPIIVSGEEIGRDNPFESY